MNNEEIGIKKAKETSIEDLLNELSASEDGLSSSESKKRAEVYGLNEISEKKVNPLVKFLSYFWGPIPWMIDSYYSISGHWQMGRPLYNRRTVTFKCSCRILAGEQSK